MSNLGLFVVLTLLLWGPYYVVIRVWMHFNPKQSSAPSLEQMTHGTGMSYEELRKSYKED